MTPVQGFFPFDAPSPQRAPEAPAGEPPPSERQPARYFEDLPREEQALLLERRARELSAIASLSFPVMGTFDGERVSILGPAARFHPYLEDLEKYGGKEDPNQLLAQRVDGRRFVSFASGFEVDGRPLLSRALPPRPAEFLPAWTRPAHEKGASPCLVEAAELALDQFQVTPSVRCPSANGERADEPGRTMNESDSTEPSAEQDQERKVAFHQAVRLFDVLRAGAKPLGFGEPELEAAFASHAKADLGGVAFQAERPGEPPAEQLLREFEREFVRLAHERWVERSKERPELEELSLAWAKAFERGGELSELQVRRALGVRNSYEEKLERRRGRLEAASERAAQRAAAACERSRKELEHIPLGQPIILGSSGERGHRAALRRSHRAMDRSLEEQRLAEELERKAKGVGKAGISADDPHAPDKIRERLAVLERRREEMKRINKEFKKGGFDAVEGLSAEGVEKLKATMARAPWIRQPFPAYSLTNIGANIRRLHARLDELETRTEEPPRAAVEGQGFRLEEDLVENRIRFVFDAKPADSIRTALKREGFRWAPSAGAWQRQSSAAGWAAAERVRLALDQDLDPH